MTLTLSHHVGAFIEGDGDISFQTAADTIVKMIHDHKPTVGMVLSHQTSLNNRSLTQTSEITRLKNELHIAQSKVVSLQSSNDILQSNIDTLTAQVVTLETQLLNIS